MCRVVIRRVLVPLVAVAWTASVLVAIVGAVSFADDVDTEQVRLERELAAFEREHAALQEWVADELRPWANEVGEAVDEGAPGAPGAPMSPSPSPLPTLAPVPSPSLPPTPSPTPSPSLSVPPIPTPSVPTVSPTPSLCLPIIC